MNAMMLSNVYMRRGDSKEDTEIHKGLGEVVYSLATTNPTWTFECRKGFRNIEEVHVHAESQRIGKLGTKYSSRAGTTAISITSDNVTARGGTITTADVKKAIREAQRNFVVKSEAKLVEESIRVIDDIIGTQRYRKNEKVRDRLMKLAQPMREYSLGLNKEAFIQFLATKDSTFVGLLNEYETTKAESDAIDAIVGYKDSNKVAYIKLYKGKYIVKTVDNVKTYDDNTLPEEYRGKLGMLKLVEDKQCISGVGCRAEADVFMITL